MAEHSDQPSPTSPRHGHIRFPVQDKGFARSRSPTTSSDGSNHYSSLGLGLPPSLRRRAIVDPGDDVASQDDSRRRVRSVDADVTLAGNGRPNTQYSDTYPRKSNARNSQDISAERRTYASLEGGAKDATLTRARFGSLGSMLSEDKESTQEDQGMLEDVRRVMKAKARHDARLRSLQSSPAPYVYPSGTPVTSAPSLVSSRGSSVPAPFASPASSRDKPRPSVDSEVDFSPSVSAGDVGDMHPIPWSSNDGATLDWSGRNLEEERRDRRWSLTAKRKAKTKTTSPTREGEGQDSIYTDKLARLKARASPRTLKKAQITSDQLSRRYASVYSSIATWSKPLNPAEVVRWYNSQEAILRSYADQSEPLTWLKHLTDRRSSKDRVPWHLTALIVEEYIRNIGRPEGMATIPEDSALFGGTFTPDRSPSSKGLSFGRSRPVSMFSVEASLSKRPSNDGYDVSFEPTLDSRRHSFAGTSVNSADGSVRNTRMPYNVESPRSSLSSVNVPLAPSHDRSAPQSPTGSRHHLRDIAKRFRRRGNDSDDGASSTRNSIHEEYHGSLSDDGRSRPLSMLINPKKWARPPTLDVERYESGTDGDASSREASDVGEDNGQDGPGPVTARPRLATRTARGQERPTLELTRSQAEPRIVITRDEAYHATPRRMRISLPSSVNPPSLQDPDQRWDDEKERGLYEAKARILEQTAQQNHRLRQLLQRVSGTIKEYDKVQSNVAGLLNKPAQRLPLEVVDAFSHDPSAVSSTTRRLKGWRAVEDIHKRVHRQRETLRSFVASYPEVARHTLPPDGLFKGPIEALMVSLQRLDDEREEISEKVKEVTTLLADVRKVQRPTKAEYNETLAHTSVVYPELSQIAILEESYKDHYQQLWEFGMDVLTLLLDTVTPFWRHYGKTIGDDVQDFLIVPWYRNEYTGEAKRYTIERLPRRSFRHWVGLLAFEALSVALTVVQWRVALLSMSCYRMPWLIDSALWWAVLPFFWLAVFVQWCAFFVECCLLGMEAGVVVWWLGWSVGMFS